MFRYRQLPRLGLLLLLLLLLLGGAIAAHAREFTFSYTARIDPQQIVNKDLRLFIPLAVNDNRQQVIDETIESSVPGTVRVDPRHGNRYWYAHVEHVDGRPIEVKISTRVSRRSSGTRSKLPRPGESAEQLAVYLQPSRLIPVNHQVLEPILAEIDDMVADSGSSSYARAIYDWIVDNMEYKKTGAGWGNGDTFWACSERFGNCTDFHSLFIALARSRNIPARFEMGFPVPVDRDSGEIGGYHCWVEVYLPGEGWFPIDASEAYKHPERRDYYYGARPTDRIHFSTGRDLALGDSLQGEPLNYFIYPHVEVGGEAYKGPVVTSFSYEG